VLLYKAADIVRISRRNISRVSPSHAGECHDKKETITVDEILLEKLILA
jgi:hypothetical protein